MSLINKTETKPCGISHLWRIWIQLIYVVDEYAEVARYGIITLAFSFQLITSFYIITIKEI